MKQRLSTYAAECGMSLRTAQRHAAEGRIPGAVQTDTGRWFVEVSTPVSPQPTNVTLQAILARLNSIEALLQAGPSVVPG